MPAPRTNGAVRRRAARSPRLPPYEVPAHEKIWTRVLVIGAEVGGRFVPVQAANTGNWPDILHGLRTGKYRVRAMRTLPHAQDKHQLVQPAPGQDRAGFLISDFFRPGGLIYWQRQIPLWRAPGSKLRLRRANTGCRLAACGFARWSNWRNPTRKTPPPVAAIQGWLLPQGGERYTASAARFLGARVIRAPAGPAVLVITPAS